MTAREFSTQIYQGYEDFENSWLVGDLSDRAVYMLEGMKPWTKFLGCSAHALCIRHMSTPDRQRPFYKPVDYAMLDREMHNGRVAEAAFLIKEQFAEWTLHEVKRRSKLCLEDLLSTNYRSDFDHRALDWTQEDLDRYAEGCKNVDSLAVRYFHAYRDAEMPQPWEIQLAEFDEGARKVVALDWPPTLPTPNVDFEARPEDVREPSQEAFWTEDWLDRFLQKYGLAQPLEADGSFPALDAFKKSHLGFMRGILIPSDVKKCPWNAWPSTKYFAPPVR